MRLRSFPPTLFRQRAGPPHAFRRSDAPAVVRYLPCAGTNGYNDPFAVDPLSPFQQALTLEGFEAIRDTRGKPFNPQMALDGVRGQHETWNTLADMLFYFLEDVPVVHRNLIVSSHFGQVAWILAASGFVFHSVTFVGTPVRYDVGAERGIANIQMAQVIYDNRVDLMGWLGSWFSGNVTGDRTFKQLGARMRRYGYDDIGHVRVLTDPVLVRMWGAEPWLDNIRAGEQSAA
jgi:hypothetical protein